MSTQNKERFTRRHFLKISATVSSGLLLAACSPAQATETAASATATSATAAPTAVPPSTKAEVIDLWIQQVSIDVMKGTANLFMEKNPKISINFIPMAQIDAANNLLAAISAGAGAPDAAFIDWNIIQKYVERDGVGVRDLKDFMVPKSDWVEWDLALATTKTGKIIGLPEDLGITMMFYRRDVVEAAGMPSDPENFAKVLDTWTNLIQTGIKLTVPEKRWLLNDAADIWAHAQNEGEIRNFDDNGVPVCTEERFVKAAELAVAARKAGIDAKILWWTSDWEVARNKVPGEIALYPCAAWWDQIIQPAAPETKGLWGVVPLPNNASSYGGGSFFVFPDMSKKFENTFKFLSFLEASIEGIDEYMKSGKFLPAYKKYHTSPVFTTPDPFYGDQVWLKSFADRVADFVPIHMTMNENIANEVMGEAIRNIVDNGAPIKDELENAKEEISSRIQ
jgi:multiple sugar transport system substrate-binding protein